MMKRGGIDDIDTLQSRCLQGFRSLNTINTIN